MSFFPRTRSLIWEKTRVPLFLFSLVGGLVVGGLLLETYWVTPAIVESWGFPTIATGRIVVFALLLFAGLFLALLGGIFAIGALQDLAKFGRQKLGPAIEFDRKEQRREKDLKQARREKAAREAGALSEAVQTEAGALSEARVGGMMLPSDGRPKLR